MPHFMGAEPCRDDGRPRCRRLTFFELCGVYDQPCEGDAGGCLPHCYSDCHACRDKAFCDQLAHVGVISGTGEPCFSVYNHTESRDDTERSNQIRFGGIQRPLKLEL